MNSDMIVDEQVNNNTFPFVPEHDINDYYASLRYARLIQHALMPDPSMLKGRLKDFFILFMPRDIVSGDFYYTFSTKNKICIAAGDCTGHGVPGALMSILGISFLNEIMQSDINMNANRILNLMREKVMKALHQTADHTDTSDSIDIGLCILDLTNGKLQFSGANRPLIMIRDGELVEYKPDKMTLGIAPDKEAPFCNNTIVTKQGDSFYLFSDGYADQFGELSNKKFKYKHFKRIIHSFESLPMSEQKEKLESVFYDWKGNVQQVDDVLVVGFQI